MQTQNRVVDSDIVYWLMPLFAVLFFLALPVFIESFYASLLSMMFIYIIAAVGGEILTGLTGIVNVGHGCFFAIVAYTTAFMSK